MLKVDTLFVFTQKMDYIPDLLEPAFLRLPHLNSNSNPSSLRLPIQFVSEFAQVCVEDTSIARVPGASFAELGVTKLQ